MRPAHPPLLLEGEEITDDVKSNKAGAKVADLSIARIVGRSASHDDLADWGAKKTDIKIDDMITRTVSAVWNADTRICHIDGTDKYCGKESKVHQRFEQNAAAYKSRGKAVLDNTL